MPIKTTKTRITCARDIKEIRKLAQDHGPDAFKRLVDLLDSKDERLILAVAQEILNRAYGKPDTGREGRDDETGPTVVVIRDGRKTVDEGPAIVPDKAGPKKTRKITPASTPQPGPRDAAGTVITQAGGRRRAEA